MSCSYAAPVSRRKQQTQGEPTPDDMQNRIDRLEGLVLSLMHGGANIDIPSSTDGAPSTSSGGATSNPSPSTADTSSSPAHAERHDEEAMHDDDESDIDEGLANSLGVLKVMDPDRSKHVYLGEEHWHTILLDIAEVKNYFANHKIDLEKSYEKIELATPTTAKQPPVLLMGVTPTSEAEIRANLPPKSTILALCHRYFNSVENATNLVHAPTFYQELRDHWEDPSKTPIMWLALLYSILSVAVLSYHKVGDEPPVWKGRVLEGVSEYRLRTVQCLVAGNYTKPERHTVEAMLLYLVCEWSMRWNADLSLYIIASMVVRIALRMGYHRDGKWFPTLTPYEAISLPSMISEHDCDTELPSNLFDEEFGRGTKLMPSPRPSAEPTPVSYLISKAKLCFQLGSILQATGRVKDQAHYDEILRFDAKLRQIKAEVPPHVKMQPHSESRDSLTVIMARYNIDILYLKIICLLHRNPAAPLYPIKWFVTSAATKDFIFPAMLIALDLHYDNAGKGSTGPQDSQRSQFWTREQRQEMINSLELTKDVWKGLADSSIDAIKAANTLEIMLAKIKVSGGADGPRSPSERSPSSASLGQSGLAEMQPEHSAAITLGMLSSGATPNSTAAFSGRQTPMGMTYSAFHTGYDPGSTDLTPVTAPSTSTGMGSVTASDFSNPMLGFDGLPSPMAMFDNVAASNMEFPTNLDWDSFENYTQTASWGTETVQFFANPDQQQQQGAPDPSIFPYDLNLTGAGRGA
ncbi:hypothetical protein N0V88_004512 [Collariella sp. IMI 366227]|nr:hypothetical protein N0V88_004512 [Collariella sp. IMI 366227]